ncbi:MAG: hypothetical protein KGR98_00115 [Verrucomicrobia bacterium]|nr:hypothetical protein [Verrucomicrobiota bacterium]MDE3099376.1 hypothetical protein [Verrucomicrobiota bacterium]
MNAKNALLTAVFLVLAAVYVIYFTDWFRPQIIEISSTSRPVQFGRRGVAHNLVAFNLAGSYNLTDVEVFPLAAPKTNPPAPPLWHLTSDAGSQPVARFFYGQPLRGMKPAVEGARPKPLQTGVIYRIVVRAGWARGQNDFDIGGVPANVSKNQ